MSRGIWQTVETSSGEVRLEKTEREESKRGSRKEKKRKEEEEKTEKRKSGRGQESGREVGDLG